jgi:hypothetical protein
MYGMHLPYEVRTPLRVLESVRLQVDRDKGGRYRACVMQPHDAKSFH